jgi:hypothetical protein
MVSLRHRAGAQHSQSPAKAERGAAMSDYSPVMLGKRLKSGLRYSTTVFAKGVPRSEKHADRRGSEAALLRGLQAPDQYRATMMMVTTSNAAISISARSNFFDRGVAAGASIGDMTQTP